MPYYVAVQPVLCQCCFNGLEARDKDAAVTFLTLNYFISYDDQLHFNGVFWGCFFLSNQLHLFLTFVLTARLLPNMHLQSTSGYGSAPIKILMLIPQIPQFTVKVLQESSFFMLLCFVQFVSHFFI